MRKAFKIFSGIFFGIIGLILALLLLATSIAYRPDKIENAVMSGKTTGPVRDDSVFSFVSWNIGYFGLGAESDFFYDGGKMTRPGTDQHAQRAVRRRAPAAAADGSAGSQNHRPGFRMG
ncbi:MAG: hypothetical protein K0B08_01695 [Bacteroidales bacterium]|nr:hypothetical protein [Bacteroidales bacterium]